MCTPCSIDGYCILFLFRNASLHTGGTILLAAAISPTTRHHTQYDALRSSLASTLGLPIGPTFSDLSNNGRRNPASISPTSPGCYSQFFPRVHSNPDTWKYWSHRLLPCRDKVSVVRVQYCLHTKTTYRTVFFNCFYCVFTYLAGWHSNPVECTVHSILIMALAVPGRATGANTHS